MNLINIQKSLLHPFINDHDEIILTQLFKMGGFKAVSTEMLLVDLHARYIRSEDLLTALGYKYIHPQLLLYFTLTRVRDGGGSMSHLFKNINSLTYLHWHHTYCDHWELDANEQMELIRVGRYLEYIDSCTDNSRGRNDLLIRAMNEIPSLSMYACPYQRFVDARSFK